MVSYRIGSGTSLMARVRQVAVMWHFATDAEARLCGCAARRQLGLRKPRLWDLLPTACAWQSPEMLLVFRTPVLAVPCLFLSFLSFLPSFSFSFSHPSGLRASIAIGCWPSGPRCRRTSGTAGGRWRGDTESRALRSRRWNRYRYVFPIRSPISLGAGPSCASPWTPLPSKRVSRKWMKFRHVQSPERAKDRGAGRDGLRGWRQGEGPRGAGSAGSDRLGSNSERSVRVRRDVPSVTSR